MSKAARTYLLSILIALAIVLPFVAIQIVFVIKTFQPQMLIIPVLISITLGLLVGKVQSLRLDLAERNRLFSVLADFALEFTYFRKLSGEYEYVSPACKKLTGYSQEDFYNHQNFMDMLVHPDDTRVWHGHIHNINGEGVPEVVEFRITTKDGQVRWIEHLCNTVCNEKGETIGVRSTNFDITERKKAGDELGLAAKVFESPQPMIITDAKTVIIRSNQAFRESTGYSESELLGKTPQLLKSGRHDGEFYREMWRAIEHTGEWQGEIWDRRKNGEIYPKWLIISAIRGNDGAVSYYLGTHFDITQRKQSEKDIERLAFYDPLTGLPNRRLLMDRLRQALVSSARIGRKGALLFLDLDNFKVLNDTLGHFIGDLLLQHAAQRLASCVRDGDTVARLGGDEFVVVLESLNEHVLDAAAQTEAICEKILAVLNEPYQLDSHEHRSTVSIGAVLFSDHSSSLEELMKQADIAMYQAKKAGRNNLRFFDPEMQEHVDIHAALENDLRRALEQQQFQLYYQIQMDNSHRPLGAEALIRWIHPERGFVPPLQFIPLAEDTGMILPIGQWVLETACAQLKAWQHDVLARNLVLAVNVSAKQFRQAEFVTQVQAVMERYGINPNLLKMELTESLLLEDIEDTIATMSALKKIGIQFSLDDFGTGYSSLQYLKKLPLDQLKIDQSFVRDIATENSDKAIVKTIIAMAQSMNFDVIAEGVETEDQRQFLLDEGCMHFQGYLFSKPLPIREFERLLKQGCDSAL